MKIMLKFFIFSTFFLVQHQGHSADPVDPVNPFDSVNIAKATENQQKEAIKTQERWRTILLQRWIPRGVLMLQSCNNLVL